MKKILCLVDWYYPESNTSTVCMDTLLEKLKQTYIVDFLAFKIKKESQSVTSYEHGKIYKLTLPQIKKLLKYNFQSKKNALFDEIASNDYDIVISTCQPFVLNVLAEHILPCYKHAKWYPVFLDPHVYNYCAPLRTAKKREKRVSANLEKAEKIFMVKGIKEENEKRGFFPDYHKKVIEISLPNLMDLTGMQIRNKNKKIVMTFAGAVYRKIRNPRKMFEILNQLGEDFEINIMSKYCTGLTNKCIRKTKNVKVNNLGYLKREECLNVLFHSNILINLGNSIPNQTPSKVLEYIGTGKPILNFYFIEDDTSLYYLKKYPLCCNVNVNTYTAEDIQRIKDFCRKNKDKLLTFEEATVNLKEDVSQVVCEKFYKEFTK